LGLHNSCLDQHRAAVTTVVVSSRRHMASRMISKADVRKLAELCRTQLGWSKPSSHRTTCLRVGLGRRRAENTSQLLLVKAEIGFVLVGYCDSSSDIQQSWIAMRIDSPDSDRLMNRSSTLLLHSEAQWYGNSSASCARRPCSSKTRPYMYLADWTTGIGSAEHALQLKPSSP
jgi:hypothetical protein